ncbi:hypothetical protein HIM_11065 [Hirsutella minnesotensis 3608]|uniref:ATP-dependent DNA helicase n=1 Tax=Hirsutella minnesotensis 3608 TaxID=1043627 RepID=A0A0F7ZWT9_9HYPO|nr:hypothetical protein HIM_11065 [Hirsutella minnesotensis 3608]
MDEGPKRASGHKSQANAAPRFRPIEAKPAAAADEASRREQAEALKRALPKGSRRGGRPRKRTTNVDSSSSKGGRARRLASINVRDMPPIIEAEAARLGSVSAEPAMGGFASSVGAVLEEGGVALQATSAPGVLVRRNEGLGVRGSSVVAGDGPDTVRPRQPSGGMQMTLKGLVARKTGAGGKHGRGRPPRRKKTMRYRLGEPSQHSPQPIQPKEIRDAAGHIPPPGEGGSCVGAAIAATTRSTADARRSAADGGPKRVLGPESRAGPARRLRPMEAKPAPVSEEASRREDAEALERAMPQESRLGSRPRENTTRANGASSNGGRARCSTRFRLENVSQHSSQPIQPREIRKTAGREASDEGGLRRVVRGALFQPIRAKAMEDRAGGLQSFGQLSPRRSRQAGQDRPATTSGFSFSAVREPPVQAKRPKEPGDGAGDTQSSGRLPPRPPRQAAVGEEDRPRRIEAAARSSEPVERRKRIREPDRDQPPTKRGRGGRQRQRRSDLQAEDLASVLRYLEEEFAVKERLSNEQTWCIPVPHERKVSTVRRFYRAFHDVDTLPIQTCMLCYRKSTRKELRETAWDRWLSSPIPKGGSSPFACRSCFREGEPVPVCAECSRHLVRGVLSPAALLHGRLGCEHVFPDELKGLTPVEEKLIALNSCYGFVTRYNVSGGQTQTLRYPKHVKGHITVFPNNVQELATNVLPHPLVRVMDEIHVSWQGAVRPTPSDLSSLLSVRPRVVERALIWLRRNNPHYAGIEIDAAEMESWGDSADGVPALVYERLERNEPSAWEKTRTAHVVPPTERAMDDDEGAVEIEEILSLLNQGGSTTIREDDEPGSNEVDEARGQSGGEPNHDAKTINEVTSSGIFALDGPPDVADVDKLRFACNVVREGPGDGGTGPTASVQAPTRGQLGHADGSEPYIRIGRGDEFADSFEASFFAKTFPTLLPFGVGGPRPVEEATVQLGRGTANAREAEEAGTRDLLSSRNMSLRTWADTVLRRHGGRFATHHIFAFLVFNMGVRSRNRRVSMLSVTRKNFRKAERILRSLTADGLAAARAELESTGKTTNDAVKELLRSLSLYGYRQPMSRELRLGMRHRILALIVRYGVPAIWLTINPNDITNPVKLRLAAHRARDPEAAEEFLRSLDKSFKRVRLSVSDPMSSAIFFHREMTLFFEHYVNIGGESVFGRISQYYGAVETNERGSLHVHGLLWLDGNTRLSSMLADSGGEEQAAYRERIVRYVDSVFSEDLDQEGFCAVQAERSATSDISSLLDSAEQFSASFEEEANFCAGATQIHTHSPTCVKYSLGNKGRKGDLCRFKAPWKLVEETTLSSDGVLRIRRTHPMVNRWNKAIAVGLRHNHDISFIATQRKTMALVYYVTNYATKVEDPTWKRVAAAAELLPVLSAGGEPGAGDDARGGVVGDGDGTKNKTRQFLMRVANRVFTERALSQVEVVAHLLGYPSEFTGSSAWAYLNVSVLYWHVSRRWRHLRQESGTAVADVSVDESVVVDEAGERIGFAEAYHHRGHVLRGLCLYDYVSLVRLQRIGKEGCTGAWGEVPFESGWEAGRDWVQVLRRPGKHAVVCLDGYLSKDFEQDDVESGHRRAAVQHLALFVPWEAFLGEERGDINEIWRRAREQLPPRTLCLVDNVQLLRRSAEDARRDAKQWAASGGDGDHGGALGEGEEGGQHPGDHDAASAYQSDDVGNATRLIDVVRSAAGASQITAGSRELSGMIQQLCRFQQSALVSTAELQAAIVRERDGRHIDMPGQVFSGAAVPPQDQVKAIKSQQTCASRERVKMIQGIQSMAAAHGTDRGAAERSVLTGFGEEDVQMTGAEAEETAGNAGAGMEVRLGPSTSFLEAGKGLTKRWTLNKKQAIAFSIICRHLDSMRQGDGGDVSQLCQFIGGEGGTGKSRVIGALVGLFAAKGIPSRLLITATSGTAAARVDGITIHSACGFTKDQGPGANTARDVDGVRLPRQAERFVNGQSRMDWQDKDVLVIDEVSMLGARTLHAVNERLCQLRGSQRDFGGIPIVLFCGDFHQFRPVQERSILLPSAAVSWDEDNSFRAEQRHQHDKAHALWKRFTTVVMLDEQMRAAGDPELQRLLKRIRRGVQDHTDLDLLNSRCHREGRRIPWETGITVVTPLNRNRWNLNMEASLAFQIQQRSTVRIFLSEHKWKDGLPTEEEAIMMLNQGDDSAIPVPAVFMFVPGMPVVVNHNTHQGLKLVNGASYTAAEVIVDKAHPGHRISADMAIHFGPPAAIILGSETTKDFHFVGMPPGTILLTPMSIRIQCHRKRPWQQNDVSRKGLPCAAAFACTDYKVQGGAFERVALELRGTRTTNVGGRAVPSQCDPYSLYVQLSRCPTLDGIMLVSKVRERDLVGNRVPGEMTAAQARLEELSDRTVREALCWLGDDFEFAQK